ncbi:dTDP-4-dehydrorhamnose reductase [Leeuwenhoekiella sp. CH_XMU1409-2]|uniref:dTDP-4-dehydrorhamnose reductase n=1 Tax=Leeuwenhoekiella sp. CH_XMU1409-2 TaxID=3107768 RepID=UPI00300928CD
MRVLITGAQGQLGRELALRKPEEVVFLLKSKKALDLTDSTALERLLVEEQITTVINCAAYTAVDAAEIHKEKAFAINGTAVKTLGALCKKHGIRLIHISTDYVFDGEACQPYQTDAVCNPVNAYGASKREGEEALLALEVPDCAIIRTSWLYSSFGENFVKTMLRLGQEKEQLNVVDDQVGSPTYAGDLADFILKYALGFRSTTTRILHYTNEGMCSWYDFAIEIMRLAGLSCDVRPIPASAYPTQAKRPSYSVLDTHALKKEFGVPIPYWRSSLETCIKQLKPAS